VIEAAQRAADDLLVAVTSRTGPFGGAHEAWLEQAAALPAAP
jgi:hypothetical protein